MSLQPYYDLLQRVLTEGRIKPNRTGIDTKAIFGHQMSFNMDDGFPLLTERPIFFRGIVEENLWFLEGVCNAEDLKARNVHIWDKWALIEDDTYEQALNMQQLSEQYFHKRKETEGETFTYLNALEELQQADKEDGKLGKPTAEDWKDASSFDELEGGAKLLRDLGIASYVELIRLPQGSLGPVYGVLWRFWRGRGGQIDQVQRAIDKLTSENPKLRYSRSILITGYDPSVAPDETMSPQENVLAGRQALAPCHYSHQLQAEPLTVLERLRYHAEHAEDWRNVLKMLAVDDSGCTIDDYNQAWYEPLSDEGKLSIQQELDTAGVPTDQLNLHVTVRSNDLPFGAPFNIAGYALLLHMYAAQVKMKPAKLVYTVGDAHIYMNQLEGVEELQRRHREDPRPLPTLTLDPDVTSIDGYTFESFTLTGYDPIKPQISFGDVAV